MVTLERPPGPRRPFRNAYIGLALLIPLTLLAFFKSYSGGVTFSGRPVTLLVHLHTALMVLWLLMLVAQAWLIRSRRFQLHRWLGRSSYALVPIIVIAMLAADHESVNLVPGGITPEGARIEVFAWGQLVAFALCWGLAIRYRKQTHLHLRFMVSTAFAISTAIVFRIILNWFNWLPGMGSLNGVAAANWMVLTLALLALIARDGRTGLKRSPFWVVTVAIGVMHLGFWTFGRTEGWFAFVQWFGSL